MALARRGQALSCTRHKMRQKLIAIGQGFWIDNEQGQNAFHSCRFRKIMLYSCYR